jgi:hypothetical protein
VLSAKLQPMDPPKAPLAGGRVAEFDGSWPLDALVSALSRAALRKTANGPEDKENMT